MATTNRPQGRSVTSVNYIALQDERVLAVRKFTIKKNKDASKIVYDALNGSPVIDEETGEAEVDKNGDPVLNVSEDDITEAFLKVVSMVAEGQKGFDDFEDSEEGYDAMMECIDEETLYEIVKVSTGVDFLAMMQRMQKLAEEEVNRLN